MRSATLFTYMLAVPVVVSSAVTCARKAGPPAVPAIQEVAGEFKSRSGHFALRYPADWSTKPTKEYMLLLEPESTADAVQVTVDVPYIPPHFPGMMTMKLVANGYVDDLKKRLSGFSVVQESDDILAGATALRLVMTGQERAGKRRGEERKLAALIAIRNEQVYILQADATPAMFGTARVAMAKMIEDWDWTK